MRPGVSWGDLGCPGVIRPTLRILLRKTAIIYFITDYSISDIIFL